MQLTVRDAARILNVPEGTVFRWIEEDGLPAYRVNDQYLFNRTELLEWVASHKGTRSLTITPDIYQRDTDAYSLAAALEAGGIHHKVGGADRDSVLRGVVALLKLPPEMDPDYLLQVLLAREKMGSTAIGEGIAIPHVRSPLIMRVKDPSVALCFLENPIDFAASDGRLVDTLFVLVAPTVRAHLQVISRIAMALQDSGFKSLIRGRATAGEIVQAARWLEGAKKP